MGGGINVWTKVQFKDWTGNRKERERKWNATKSHRVVSNPGPLQRGRSLYTRDACLPAERPGHLFCTKFHGNPSDICWDISFKMPIRQPYESTRGNFRRSSRLRGYITEEPWQSVCSNPFSRCNTFNLLLAPDKSQKIYKAGMILFLGSINVSNI